MVRTQVITSSFGTIGCLGIFFAFISIADETNREVLTHNLILEAFMYEDNEENGHVMGDDEEKRCDRRRVKDSLAQIIVGVTLIIAGILLPIIFDKEGGDS